MAPNITPANTVNAVDAVIFAVVFNKPLSGKELKNPSYIQSIFGSEFPICSPLANLHVSIENNRILSQNMSGSGVSLSTIKPDGTVARQIELQENRIVIVSREYDRWHNVWNKIDGYIKNCLAS